MKILFLDIDGVLNSFDDMYARNMEWKISKQTVPSRDDHGQLFDERCVRWLRYIVHKTECVIVLSSTWRKNGLTAIKYLWRDRNLPGTVIDITPDLGTIRGKEIETWLKDFKDHVDTYCIVDDDSDMLEGQSFVQIDGNIGLTKVDVGKIINILND